MTDNEIINALECWSTPHGCTKCPFIEQGCFDCGNIPMDISKNILGLINHQKAEIERLKKENRKQKLVLENIDNEIYPTPFITDFDKAIANAKSEAIKEFVQRLKAKCKSDLYHYYKNYVEFEDIDNLVKEITEEKR